MPGYVVGVLSARIATLLCIVTIALPYLLRKKCLRRIGLTQEGAVPYVRRLRLHFWTGYVILALSTLHAGTAMSAMRRANRIGVWAATVAFFLLVYEIALGLVLKDSRVDGRRSLRKVHFWIMLAFAAVLAVHLAMSGV
jgi:hypothetical protein